MKLQPKFTPQTQNEKCEATVKKNRGAGSPVFKPQPTFGSQPNSDPPVRDACLIHF